MEILTDWQIDVKIVFLLVPAGLTCGTPLMSLIFYTLLKLPSDTQAKENTLPGLFS